MCPAWGKGFDLQPIASSLALTYPEIGAGRAGSLGSEQMQVGIHQPWSHVCCRMRQINLVGGSRRKASPGCPCPSARLVPSGRTGERGLEPSRPSNAWAGLSLALGPDGARQLHSDGSQRWPTANLCRAHSLGKQGLPNEQVCSPPCSQYTWPVRSLRGQFCWKQ